jgi:hypothetical protein
MTPREVNPTEISEEVEAEVSTALTKMVDDVRRYEAFNAESPWRPITTAPKDGTAILIWPAQSALTGSTECMIISYVVRWHDWKEAWIEASGEEYDTFHPTHWMPLPEPPEGY